MKISLILILLISLSTFGCMHKEEKKIDATTDTVLIKSLEEVIKEIPDSQKQEFEDALTLVAAKKSSIYYLFTTPSPEALNFKNKIKLAIHGKSAREIIKNSKQVKNDLANLLKANESNELKELEAKKQLASISKTGLLNFKITDPIIKNKKRPIISFTFKNKLSESISRIYIKGEMSSMVKENNIKSNFTHTFSGGISPNKNTLINLYPRRNSGWSKTDLSSDYELKIEITRINDMNDKPVFDINAYREEQETRYQELIEKNR